MEKTTKPVKVGYFGKHSKLGAAIASVVIHIILLVIAGVAVAVTVIDRKEVQFETPKKETRPHVKLKKLTVPVAVKKKQMPKPRLRKNIVAQTKIKTSQIVMPTMQGVKGGTGYLKEGSGLSLGFGMELDLFGGGRGTGNEFVGKFYDLKQNPDKKITEIGEMAAKDSFGFATQLAACEVIKSFVSSGCPPKRLARKYFTAPTQKYATAFMMPPMAASEAPKAFEVENLVKPSYWMCHYRGQIAAPETGEYRFCGLGDDILIVRANRRVVLDGCWPALIKRMTNWESGQPDNRKFSMNSYKYGSFDAAEWRLAYAGLEERDGLDEEGDWNWLMGEVNTRDHGKYMKASSRMVIGEWITLRKGQRVDVDIIIGEIPGGEFACRLLIEKKGANYQKVNSDAGLRPILPVFKTTTIDNQELIQKMQIDPKEMTLNGPVFGVKENSAQ